MPALDGASHIYGPAGASSVSSAPRKSELKPNLILSNFRTRSNGKTLRDHPTS
jgi:hypothetical protein